MQIWPTLGNYGVRWPMLSQFVPRWPALDHDGPHWPTLRQFEPLCVALRHAAALACKKQRRTSPLPLLVAMLAKFLGNGEAVEPSTARFIDGVRCSSAQPRVRPVRAEGTHSTTLVVNAAIKRLLGGS